MRTQLFLLCIAAAALPSLAQSPAAVAPQLPKDPHALLAAAAPFYDFSDPSLKPWHLKASYQLYDPQGNPAEQGTWEYWWTSPKADRSSWTRTGMTRTDWWNAGTLYRKQSGGPLHYFERNLDSFLMSRIPSAHELDSGKLKLGLKTISSGKSTLTCATTTYHGKLQSASPEAEYYCFDPETLALRLTYSNQITAQFNEIVKTQGHYLARQVTVSIGKQTALSISIDAVQAFDPADAALSPPADAVVSHTEVGQPASVPSGEDVAQGSLVSKTVPAYPPGAKAMGVQGVVVLAAVIGRDGRIQDLDVLKSPSPALAESAVNAVKQWQYKPFLLNGEPIEIETTINVFFSLQ